MKNTRANHRQVRGRMHVNVLVFLLALVISFIYRINQHDAIKPAAKTPVPHHVQTKAIAEYPNTWDNFVSSLKKSCAQQSDDITVDYDAVHEFAGTRYGVVVIAWKESEYEVDLYRNNSKIKGWESSPIHEGDSMDVVDVQATAKKWKLPEESIREWLNSANQFMQEKYQKQAK